MWQVYGGGSQGGTLYPNPPSKTKMNEFETWFPHEFLTILSNPCVLFANPIHRKYDHFVIFQNKPDIQGAKWDTVDVTITY
jgi:hypothetical protein